MVGYRINVSLGRTRWEITYEKMCYMLEELLKEADYYKETEFFEDLPAGL
jgi:hypothetical protein